MIYTLNWTRFGASAKLRVCLSFFCLLFAYPRVEGEASSRLFFFLLHTMMEKSGTQRWWRNKIFSYCNNQKRWIHRIIKRNLPRLMIWIYELRARRELFGVLRAEQLKWKKKRNSLCGTKWRGEIKRRPSWLMFRTIILAWSGDKNCSIRSQKICTNKRWSHIRLSRLVNRKRISRDGEEVGFDRN